MMSTFESDYEADSPLDGRQFGLCGYGSGAKAKVFEESSAIDGEVVASWNLFERMAGRMAIEGHIRTASQGIHDGSVLKPRVNLLWLKSRVEKVNSRVQTYAWVDNPSGPYGNRS